MFFFFNLRERTLKIIYYWR